MSVKIGISPIAWQNDDLPEMTRDFTMEQALQEAREIGYKGVERGRRMPEGTEELRACLEANALSLCGGWFSGNLLVGDAGSEIEAMKGQLAQFLALDAPCIVYGECSNSVQGERGVAVNDRPRLSRDEIRDYGRKLGEVAKFCAGEGMALSFHHHMGSIIEAEADIDALMEGAPEELHLCFDTGHLLFGGGDVMATMERWAHRILHMHYKDIRPDVVGHVREKGLSFIDAIIEGAFTVPGDGSIDFDAVTKKLKAMDYSGWIVVEAEQDPRRANPYEYSKMGYKHIIQCCKKAGLDIAN